MNDEELDRKLRLLDAVDGQPDRSVAHPAAKTALFEEITMNTSTQERNRNDATVIAWEPARSKSRRALTMIASAAAAVAVVAAGIVIVESGSAPTANAMIIDAAAQSAEFESGRITTTLQIDEMGDDPASDGLAGVIDYRFENNNARIDFRFTDSHAVETEAAQIRIGEDNYVSTTEGEWVGPATGDEVFDLAESFGLSSEPTTPDSIVELVKVAEDLTEASSSDDTTTYTGTIRAASLVEIGNDLPAGLSLLASGEDPAGELPVELGLSVTVADGVLDEVVVDMDGNTPDGVVIDATITIAYSEYGMAQGLTAPGPSQIVPSELPDFDELGEEFKTDFDAAIEALVEVDQRRPGLCHEAGEGLAPDDPAATRELEACFVAAGEPAAAEAAGFLSETIESED